MQENEDVLEKLIKSADCHAEDSGEFDYAIGDLQEMLRAAWAIMSTEQKRTFLSSDAVADTVEMGSRDEFTLEYLMARMKP